MKNEVIKKSIEARMPIADMAKKIGCAKSSLYFKLNGTCPWKITELLSIARACEWTVEEFLSIIEWKEKKPKKGAKNNE